jgi:peptide/nickel transport system substrate-binding protein
MTTGALSRYGRTVVGLVVSLGLLAAACGGDDGGGNAAGGNGAGDDAAAQDPAEVADRSAELTFAYSTGLTSLDPHTTSNFSGDQLYQRPVYDRLVTIGSDDQGKPILEPQLATSWEYADDVMSVTFTLRDDVTFQDGTPFNADAVKANIERALGPDSTVASQIPFVESVEAVNDTTVVFHLSQPDPAVPWELANNTTGYMASPAAFDSDLATAPVGSGPFKLVSAERDGDVVYERWDDHWNSDAALVQGLTITTVNDQNARYNGTRSGQIDATFLATPLDAESQSLEGEGFHWDHALSPVTVGVLLNSEVPPFDDVRVRQAVSMAVNRAEISETLMNGINPPVYQVFTEGIVGHDPDLNEEQFDLDAARALVEDAGADGSTVEMIQATTAPQDVLAEAVQQSLGDIGIDVELVPLSPTEARPEWRTGGYAAFVAPIIGQPAPSQTLDVSFLSADNPATPPADLVDMAREAAAQPVDSDEQQQAYEDIAAWLVENPVHVPIVQFSTVILSRPEVVGFENMMTTGIAELDFRGVGVTEP